MPPVARITDLFFGTCYCHDDPIQTFGIIVDGSPDVAANGLDVARIGDLGVGFCGHTCFVSSGSGAVATNGIPTARIGDSVSGCIEGTIITGSPSVTAGG